MIFALPSPAHLSEVIDHESPNEDSDEISLQVHVAMPIAAGSKNTVGLNRRCYWKSFVSDATRRSTLWKDE